VERGRIVAGALWITACSPDLHRHDDAEAIEVAGGGSIQNPCVSPDGATLVFTRWRGGYNEGSATVERRPLGGGTAEVLTAMDQVSVNLPGACFSTDGRLTFSSTNTTGRDEIFVLDPDGTLHQVTDRPGFVAFEPSLSPDGEWIVFESHVEDVEGDGALFKVRSDGNELTMLTDGSGDDRQPNWSPDGSRIVFQSHGRDPGNIDLYTIDPDGGTLSRVTTSSAEDTDASFSPDGARIVFSSDHGGLELANLFVIPVEGGEPQRITNSEGYDGAPTWAPDSRVLFETRLGDPDDSPGTSLASIDAPG
jgi:TolB protein